MSRRKQQNPKPFKCGETSADDLEAAKKEPQGELLDKSPPSPMEATSVTVKDEPASPISATLNPCSPPTIDVPKIATPQILPVEPSLELLLGIPEDAPLKVQRLNGGGYKVLSAKHITAGAGLDPLRAHKIEPEDESVTKSNPQIVSFIHLEGKVFFQLEASINCGWLKYLGAPSDTKEPNLRISFDGTKLWVEVIKDLSEDTELVAVFCEPNQPNHGVPNAEVEKGKSSSPTSAQLQTKNSGDSQAEVQYPCSMCGVSFRNPNTLLAHKKHYCSKLNPTSATSNVTDQDAKSTSSGVSDGLESSLDNAQQTAYVCLICKYMSLTKADITSHIREKHTTDHLKMVSAASGSSGGSSTDKTYCEECDIHFKKSESYQAHKLHYCKSRTASTSHSPRSDQGVNPGVSQRTSPVSPNIKDMYKKVSVFDNQALNASLASQAAAAVAAASLPFTLSSMLSLPTAMAALPMMSPHLNMFTSPAHLAQAMQSLNGGVPLATTPHPAASVTRPVREDTPLDLSVKVEDGSALSPTNKRKSDSIGELASPPAKSSKVFSEPSSPLPSGVQMLSRPANGGPLKPERQIYRCERCSIPFYKKDVYEAHKVHYCSRRPTNNLCRENELPSKPVPAEQPSPPVPPVATAASADDRLVITYTCNKCSTSYRTIETFTAHQCAVPPPSPPSLRCDLCNFSTKSSRILAEHSETHQKSNLIYKCRLCGYLGNTLRGMRQHGRQHMLDGTDFSDNDIDSLELPPSSHKLSVPPLITAAPYHNNVDEELLRLKNEPYKKRRSRKHYQKSEYVTAQVSPRRKENELFIERAGSSSPQSVSAVSCTSPLQNSTMNVPQSNKSASNTSTAQSIKREPIDIIVDPGLPMKALERQPVLPDRPINTLKPYVCSCNASFSSMATFEAHKKLYCPHHKEKRNGAITVNN